MPVIKATKLIKEAIKNENAIDIPIIVLSAQDDIDIIKNALSAGASEFSMEIIS